CSPSVFLYPYTSTSHLHPLSLHDALPISISGPVELEVHAAYGYKRVTPDLDGTLSACKPMIDGLVDAGIIYDDDQVQRLIVTHEKLKTRKHVKPTGWTRFVIREMEP